MTKNIVNANVQGTETSVKKVNYKGTTKDVFEVGCQYETTYGPKFEVIARKGNKLTIKHLTSNYYNNAGDIENKRIYLAGCEETNFTELLKWKYGAEVFPIRKVPNKTEEEYREEEYREELMDTLQDMYEHLSDAASLGSNADDFFRDLGEENEDIVYITSTLYDAINMLKNLVKQQQKVA